VTTKTSPDEILNAVKILCQQRAERAEIPLVSPKEVQNFLGGRTYGAVKVAMHRLMKDGLLRRPTGLRGEYELTEQGQQRLHDLAYRLTTIE